MTSALLPQLQSIVGAPHVLSSGDLTAFERDWRGRMQGKALCVVQPASTDEVAQVVKACAAAGAPMVPQGGNTGLVMGSTQDESGREVVLNLQRLNRIRAVDKANLTLTAEPVAFCTMCNKLPPKQACCSPSAWRPRAVAPLAVTWAATPVAPKCCATAIRETFVWDWKW